MVVVKWRLAVSLCLIQHLLYICIYMIKCLGLPLNLCLYKLEIPQKHNITQQTNIIKPSISSKALRATDDSVNPIIISVGHKITLGTAIGVVTKCCKVRVPEPVRKLGIFRKHILPEFMTNINLYPKLKKKLLLGQ